MDIKGMVRDFIVKNFYVSDQANLTDDASLVGQGIIDSSGILEVISFIEENFAVKVEEKETTPENLGSIKQIAGYVERKTGKAAAVG